MATFRKGQRVRIIGGAPKYIGMHAIFARYGHLDGFRYWPGDDCVITLLDASGDWNANTANLAPILDGDAKFTEFMDKLLGKEPVPLTQKQLDEVRGA